ncbi:ABC-type uncharacterized transport system, auxiliary component [Sulfitobacter noctilucicola]|uniref:Cholesterol transport system auxiliary component n=1 Tax=Sulfitobacter noctilucicola TaxID=1342301 RepID=A0A7W6M5J8_9RHOB|nr:ABC-type transport auxiliary lipoprotein family protein [Sulfitobacter noctilucicola]KIN62696.1 ABC-type uncharacterized transport system, auxiliary component [Sulfitobacter noctilucicola]MBB4172771.1 cholesterol transport system auxiliary component [Sulfitobacter noctilucicola]
MFTLTRRSALLGAAASLSGCSAISTLNAATEALDTYDLRPVAGSTSGPRRARTLLVARPQAPATLSTDRILVRSDAASISYLPDARWTDELPEVIQSLLILSISATGRVSYVGRTDAGPVPDKALLVRIDAFDVSVAADGRFMAQVDMDLTVVNDQDQRIIASRRFLQTAQASNDTPAEIVAAFQRVIEDVLPTMSDWTLRQV